MLAGMLLNVIEAAIPIDAAVNLTARNRAIREVNQAAVFFIENFDDFRFAESTRVMRLPARSGIKRGAIENDTPPIGVLFTRNYLGVEFAQERIVIVEALCDRGSAQLIDLKSWTGERFPRLRYICIRCRY